MFADLSLARQLELGEARLCAEIAELVRATHPDRRALVSPLAGGLVCFSGLGSPSNKAVGVGLDQPLDLEALDAVEADWRERGEPMRVELASLAEPSVGRALTGRDYRLIGFENVLGRSLDDVTPPQLVEGLTLEPLAADDIETWLRIAIDGFATPDDGPAPFEQHARETLEAVMQDFVRMRGLRRYLACLHGESAGCASLRVEGTVAALGGAATLPAYRRRGIQTALFRQRLVDAAADGCRLATVTTQPGSKSQANAQRGGFAVLYTRAILVREWDRT